MIVELSFMVVAVILFLGFFGERVFEYSKIPDVIWLIVIGIVLGAIGWTSSEAFTEMAPFFTTFALLFLLFEAGINTDIRSFLRTAPKGLALSFLGFLGTFIVVAAIGFALGYSVQLALLMGAILAGVSSAVVIPVLKSMELNEKTKLSLLFDSAFSDVLCILGTVTLVEIFTIGGNLDGFGIARDVVSSFLIAIAIGILAALVWNNVLHPKIKAHSFVLTLAFMLFVYAFTQLFGANGAIASLVFGLILGNTQKIKQFIQQAEDPEKALEKKKKEEKMLKKAKTSVQAQKKLERLSVIQSITKESRDVYSELAFAIKTFFFVYLGLLIDFSTPISFVYAGIILVGIFLARPFVVAMVFPKETKLQDANMLASLIPKGLAAAVLVQLPIQAGIPGAESLVNITLAVVLLSIVFSAIFSIVIAKRPHWRGLLPFLFRKFQR